MRPDLLPGLLQAAARNQARGFMDLGLFEVGPVFAGGEPEDQDLQVAGLLVGSPAARSPHGERRPADVFDARADAEAILAALGAPARLQTMRDVDGWWHPGRSGRIGLGPKVTLAVFGEVHPRALRAFDLRGPVVAFSAWPTRVPEPRRKTATRPALDLTGLQAVERDFAFVVDAEVEAAKLVQAAQGADKALDRRGSRL